jgi:hypothetical protein
MNETSQRRSNPRHRFSCRAHFHNPYLPAADAEQFCVTRDFSRDGVYFIANDNGFRENMRLLMRFPEGMPAAPDQEYLVEVMRMNALPEDRCGVGARLILRAMLGRCREMIAPKADIPLYGRLQLVSDRLVDLHV